MRVHRITIEVVLAASSDIDGRFRQAVPPARASPQPASARCADTASAAAAEAPMSALALADAEISKKTGFRYGPRPECKRVWSIAGQPCRRCAEEARAHPERPGGHWRSTGAHRGSRLHVEANPAIDSRALPRVTRPTNPDGVSAQAPLRKNAGGGSGSFLVRADNGRRYWCKTLNNVQGERVPLNEQVVAKMGLLIGAPVCEPNLVYMPQDLAGWKFRDDREIEVGWAHGSLAVDLAVETHDLANRASDDNARRHVGIYALYDWAVGSDPQWLTAGTDFEYHSHDHGHYFPNGPAWSAESLSQAAASVCALGVPATGLDTAEVNRVADRLAAVTEQEVVHCVSNVPAEWPVTDDELEAVVDFVYGRRQSVAERLRALLGTK